LKIENVQPATNSPIATDFPWLWLMRVTSSVVFMLGMIFARDHVSPWLGPLGMFSYGVDPCGLVFCLICLTLLGAFLIKPTQITAAISLLGLFIWWFMGLVVQGIAC
jgi:hypothetical protein